MSLDDLHDYYSRLPCEAFDRDGVYPTDRLIGRFLEQLPNGCRILDFGCNTGRILRTLTSRHVCLGIEPNDDAARIARQRGIEIITEDEVRFGRHDPFDVIILADVYEHLPQPVESLAMLAKALKPGGHIAIVTGNGDAVRSGDRLAEFWYCQLPGHLHMIGERHAHWLEERMDVRLVRLERCSHYTFPVPLRVKQHFQYSAYYQFKRKPRSAISAVLRRTPVVCRAERWQRAPALTCTADHFVAIYQTQLNGDSATSDAH